MALISVFKRTPSSVFLGAGSRPIATESRN
jgi:hypothetical protein